MSYRPSVNEVARSDLELGTTTNWVISFESVGSNSPDSNQLNLIANDYAPVSDYNFEENAINIQTITIGPGVQINIPVSVDNSPNMLSLTFYDTHDRRIRKVFYDWIEKHSNLKRAISYDLSQIKSYLLMVHIYYFDKQGNSVDMKSFYVLPPMSIPNNGDQSFSSDTIPMSFTVIGRQ